MTSYFDITPVSAETVSLGKDRKSRFMFTVTSRAELTVRAIVQAVAVTNRDLPSGTQEVLATLDTKWLAVAEEGKEKPPAGTQPRPLEFRPKETRQVVVDLEAPEKAPGGLYRFKLVVALEEDPGAHSSSSTSIGFKIPEAGEKPKPKWPLILAAVGGVLVLGLGITFAISAMGSETPASQPVVMVDVPMVEGTDFGIAVAKLVKADLTPLRGKVVVSPDKPEGIVLAQTPKAGEKLEKDGLVELEVVGRSVKVPAITGKLAADGESLLNALDLACKVTGDTVTGKPPKTILTQSPAPDTKVAPGTIVQITIEGQGVVVPNVVGATLTNALMALQAHHLDASVVTNADGTKAAQTVAAQAPAQATRVPAGTKVKLTVAVPPGRPAVNIKPQQVELMMKQNQLPKARGITK